MADVTEQTYLDFKELRKAKRAPITERAIQSIRSEAKKLDITLENALIECCARGWQGFKAEWLNKSPPPQQKNQKFDPVAYVNRNRISGNDKQNHRIIDIK